MVTDKPIRQLNDFNILSDLSPLAMAASADPRLMSTTSNKQRMTILNIMGFPDRSYSVFRSLYEKASIN